LYGGGATRTNSNLHPRFAVYFFEEIYVWDTWASEDCPEAGVSCRIESILEVPNLSSSKCCILSLPVAVPNVPSEPPFVLLGVFGSHIGNLP